MVHHDELIARDINAYLKLHENKSFLRFITCGSVDDGKSTLIGRLLYDSKLIYEDQLETIERDSKKSGTQGGEIDLALLVDGLAAEREQGITIDVAYRFFSTAQRKFIVADTPGHEQYTRNMATGASTADLAIILIDARHGVQIQTRRHAFITSLLGIRQLVVAINKMDLVDFSQRVFSDIEQEFRKFARELSFDTITCLPISALEGDNISTKSNRMAWYPGKCLLAHLEESPTPSINTDSPFRMHVQWVNRPHLDFRGFSGTIAAGKIEEGSAIIAIPSGQRSTVKSIISGFEHVKSAQAGQAVTISLEDQIDISRGDILCEAESPTEQSDQFKVHLVWMSHKSLYPSRDYFIKAGTKITSMTVTDLKHRVNVNNFEKIACKSLSLNEIGVCNISLSEPIGFAPYLENKALGSFIIIDRMTNETVGMGLIDHSLRRASNVVWQEMEISLKNRSAQKYQKPVILWFTGLSGSGKSTIANTLEKKLFEMGRHTYILDGDNVRHGLNKDLGFTDTDRIENIRRVGEVSKLMLDAGLIVMTSFISPFKAEREMARRMVEPSQFIEIYISTPLEVAESRDVKGLYAKARRGEIKNFTGIDSDYQSPETAEIVIETTKCTVEEATDQITEYLIKHNYL